MTKKNNIKGIVIPKECGVSEKYELTAIMYHDGNTDSSMKEYVVFITKEDYENNKPYTSIRGNMNPTLLLFPNNENAGSGSLVYDLVEADLIYMYEEDI